MHIGIDARLCGLKHRGIGRYLEKLIMALADLPDNHRYTLFSNRETSFPRSLPAGKFKIVEVNLPWYGLAEQLRFPFLIAKAKVDLMHWPNFNVPIFCPVPFVVTAHDLIVYHYPDSRATTLPAWRYWLKLRGYNYVLKRALKKARRVIAVSEFTRRDLLRHFILPAEKIKTVYLGVDKLVLQTATLPNTTHFDDFLRDRFAISKPFILYVGSFYPHKNLANLLTAFHSLRSVWDRDWQLVLAGRKDYFYQQLKRRTALSDQDGENIIFTGEVSDKILDGLYRAARVFVFPSFYEGFGLPPLEAAARGLPVIAARAGALPEILGDAAYYFDPQNPSALAEALNAVGGSAQTQARLALKGFRRCQSFSWQRAGEQTVKIYEQA